MIRVPAAVFILALIVPATAAADTAVSADLGPPDVEKGLRNTCREDGTDGEDDAAAAAGPAGDIRGARRNRGSADDDYPDRYLYFTVTDPEVKASPRLRIAAVLYDDPAFAGAPVAVSLDYTDSAATGPLDLAHTYRRHPRTWTLGGTGSWVRHAWSVADAGLRSFMNGASDFRFALGDGRAWVDRIEVVAGDAPPPPEEVLVGAHYYPWYDVGRWNYAECVAGALRLELDPAQAPALGRYDSSTPAVVDQHLRWCAEHGVNLLILEFIAPGGREDSICRNAIFPHRRSRDVRWTVLYDWAIRFGNGFDLTPERIATARADFDHLARTYFVQPTYCRVGGRPVAMIYVTRALRGNVDGLIGSIREACAARGSDVFLVGDEFLFVSAPAASRIARWDGIFGYDAYAGRGGHWGSNGTLDLYRRRTDEYRAAAAAAGVLFIPSCAPGFNDRAVRRTCADNPALPRQLAAGADGTSLFREVFAGVALGRADALSPIVSITSFNEWHEDTMIEPTAGRAAATTRDTSASGTTYTQGYLYEDHGTAFLDCIRDATLAATGTVRGPSGLLAGATVEVIDGAVPVLARTTFSTGAFTVPRLPLRVGATYRLRASASGLPPVLSAPFAVDAAKAVTGLDIVLAANEPPAVSIASPADGAVFREGDPIAIEVTASDPEGDLDRVEILGGVEVLATLRAPPFRAVWTGAPAGTATIVARAHDGLGASRSTAVQVTVEAPPRFLRADANADGDVDVTDAIAVLGNLFLGVPAIVCPAAADVDGSRELDVTDAIVLLVHLFLGGPPPPAPYPGCGPGSRADLPCPAFPPCPREDRTFGGRGSRRL